MVAFMAPAVWRMNWVGVVADMTLGRLEDWEQGSTKSIAPLDIQRLSMTDTECL